MGVLRNSAINERRLTLPVMGTLPLSLPPQLELAAATQKCSDLQFTSF
jgi:hypothetical protein